MGTEEVESNVLDDEFRLYWDRVNCYVAHQVPFEQRCDFVTRAVDCNRRTNVIPYMRLMACELKIVNKFQELAYLILFVLLCFMILILLMYLATNYYSPALKTVSKLIHMNEHLAGVTLLAFGNSSADLLSNLASVRSKTPVLSNSLSSALFVSMVSGGVICFVNPFMMNGFETVRDILFLIFGAAVVHYFLITDNGLSELEFLLMILVYFLYILVNIVDLYLLRRQVRIFQTRIEYLQGLEQTPEILDELEDLEKLRDRFSEDHEVEFYERRSSDVKITTIQFTTKRMLFQTRVSVNAKHNRNVMYDRTRAKNFGLFKEFLLALRPFKCHVWHKSNMLQRAKLLVRAPIVVICALYIPLVDYEMKKHGWNKLLNTLHIVLNPALSIMICSTLLATSGERLWYVEILDAYIYGAYSMLITVPIALFIFCNSRTDMPPSYHWVFTIINLTGSMFMICICATEIDRVLEVISHILDLKEEVMGATVKAWTCNLGPLVANTAMALHGYPKMAYASAIGGPIFTIVMSTSAVMWVRKLVCTEDTVSTEFGEYGYNAMVFLLIGLIGTLIWSTTLGFFARRSMGLFSIAVYCIHLSFVLLIQKGVVHSFAYDKPLKAAIGDI